MSSSGKLHVRALLQVPRSVFASNQSMISGRSIPSLSAVQTLLDALSVNSNTRLLQIGSGSGYFAAVASRIAREVYCVERLAPLIEISLANFANLEIQNIHLHCGDGFKRWPRDPAFDAILISASTANIPGALFGQLSVGGSLVAMIGDNRSNLRMLKIVRHNATEFEAVDLGSLNLAPTVADILVGMEALDMGDVLRAKTLAEISGRSELEELRDLEEIDEIDFFNALSVQRKMELGEARVLLRDIDLALFERIPRDFLDHHQLIPVHIQDNKVVIATCNLHATIVDDLRNVFPDFEIKLVLLSRTDFRRVWAAIEVRQSGLGLFNEKATNTSGVDDLLKHDSSVREAHAVALFQALLLDAIAERASDIHLECFDDNVRVRMRVDGELHDIHRYGLSKGQLRTLVNVIKIRSNLDISERRLPQGGRMRLRAGGDIFDLRVQTQPSLYAEHVVIRLLPEQSTVLSIEELGFPPALAKRYLCLLAHPSGLILVVGPTGSGKTTTLYAALKTLTCDTSRKVITIEDPIEYSLPGIQQTQVKPAIGFHFADAMRSFVRQDPDVILVGEIRDPETALETMRASQTGHVVLSTMHCKSAVDAVQRLLDLGVHRNSIGSELLTVVAQRLAKRICPACSRPSEPDPEILKDLYPKGAPADFVCFEGKGCSRCDGRGTRGRVAIVELLEVGTELRSAISRGLPLEELRLLAKECGLHTLREAALDHVRAGRIPLSELRRLLSANTDPGQERVRRLHRYSDSGVSKRAV